MKNLTTPQAILFGLGMIALAIASVPITSKAFTYKISICDESGYDCSSFYVGDNGRKYLRISF